MKSIFLSLIYLVFLPYAWSQSDSNEVLLDSLYKEDQFYAAVTYNLISSKPKGVAQSGFSSGFHFGYTKDMPLNTKRNVALGVGLGLSFNSFNQNLLISETAEKSLQFTIVDDAETPFTKNKFTTYMLELPIELRWRTSTAKDYKFWRIYTGFKLGYVFMNGSKYEGLPKNVKLNNIDAFNRLQYGLSLSAGYNTWNFYVYYALNPIFKGDSILNGQPIDTRALKAGLMFYIL